MGKVVKVVFGVCVACLLAACGVGEPTGDTPVTSTSNDGVFSNTLSAQNAAKSGDSIPIKLTITNVTSKHIGLVAMSEFVDISNAGTGGTIRTVYCPVVLAPDGYLDYAPGETKEYTFSWDQKDSQGNSVAPGNYTVSAGVGLEININLQ